MSDTHSLTGWMQERFEAPRAGLGPFWIGCIAGIMPWLAITICLVGPGADQHPPGFVDGIFFSPFLFFNCFAVNQWLQCKALGNWNERVYITLSLVAKSLLAWQIFASTLASSAAN